MGIREVSGSDKGRQDSQVSRSGPISAARFASFCLHVFIFYFFFIKQEHKDVSVKLSVTLMSEIRGFVLVGPHCRSER